MQSNTVVAVVQALESIALDSDRGAIAAPGGVVSFAHRLTNTGNAVSSVRLDLVQLGGDDYDLAGLALHADANGNGLADAGEAPLNPGDVLPIGAGASADVVVTGTVPAGTPPFARARVRLTATTLGQGASAAVQDSAVTPASAVPPAIAFYEASDYASRIRVSPLGQPLYVQARAPGCNLDPLAPDTVAIDLTAQLTGDRDHLLAVETGASTGIFQITPSVATTVAPPSGTAPRSGVLEVRRGDLVTAELAGCGAALTTAQVWIEPYGLVFDARRGLPVPGVRVQLLDVTGEGNGGLAGGPARVWQDDGVTPAPDQVISDAQGQFRFPRVAASTYRFVVGAPAPFVFPAPVPPAALPPGFLVDAAGSYGAPFRIAIPDAPVALDLPVDGGAEVALFVEKSADRAVVEPGEALEYTVHVANRSDSLLAAVSLHDALPPGFAYLRGSARRDGTALADPVGGAGPSLDFALGALDSRATASVSYRVRVGAGAVFGEALNQAQASAGPWRSNRATARVRVAAGVFAEEATLVGGVRLATSADATGGTGIAGVRLWLDDGTFAITDAEGRYSFTGVTPRTHALKVDATTLPAGARLVASDHRDSGQPGLRFVDLTRGEVQRAEFTVRGDSLTERETGARMLAATGRRDDLVRSLGRGTASLLAPTVPGDARALPAQGISTGETTLPLAPPASTVAVAAEFPGRDARDSLGVPPGSPAVGLDQLAHTLDSRLGFVGIADLDTVGGTQMAVRVKGPIGTPLVLRVNGERVPESRVGLRVTATDAGLEAWEYVGLALRPGINLLEIAPGDAGVSVRVVAPGPLARLDLEAPVRVPADGRSMARIRMHARDAAGVPVGARTLVTVTATAGTLRGEDLDPAEPGMQVAVEGGVASVLLEAPASPADAHLVVSAGALEADAHVRFVPDLRPLLAVGAFEGRIGLGSRGTFQPGAQGAAAGFEAPTEQFASVRRDGQAMAAAHGAMFVKGRVRDGLLLTLGYDSDRAPDYRQFRDQQTEPAYPLFGDGATRGYEAQSTGRLYARLDDGPGSLLYGDFVTRGSGSARSLAAYNRSLTGAQGHWEHRLVAVDGFSSRDRSHLRVVELPAVGLSGPYTVPGAPLVENSERVEIVVKDRNQPGVVRSVTVRQRFTDYELEPLTGRLVFRAPVPSVDAELNPVFVRVTCESEGGGEPFWVSGGEAHVHAGPRVDLGGTYVDDHDPLAPRELRGISVAAHVGERGHMEAEVASTRTPGQAAGYGSRFELSREGPGLEGRVWAASTGAGFDNASAGLAAARTEGGARWSAPLGSRTRLRSEALWSADALGRDRRAGLLLGAERTLSAAWRGELGMRLAGEERAGVSDQPWSAALRTRLSLQPPARPAWSGYAEVEQDVRETDRRMAAIGGEYRVRPQGRLYVRHELLSSLTGPFGLSDAQRQLSSVAGVDVDLPRETHLFSEYRLGDAFAGRESQAAVGLRNGWRLSSGVRLGTTFERVSPLSGSTAGPSTAVSASVDFTDSPLWKGSSRFEVRSSRASQSYLQTLAAAVRLDSSWTGIFRHHFDLTDAAGAPGGARLRVQAGAAWRPGGAWDGLGRYEFRYDRDGLGPAAAAPAVIEAPASRRRLADIVSLAATGMLDRHFVTSLAWAGKRVRDEGDLGVTRGAAQWARSRFTLDLAHDWDVGLQSSVRIGNRLTDRRTGLGAEVGRQLSPGVWLSLGWNRFGYRDDELTGEDWTRAGAYLRLRCKFDEELFGIAAPSPSVHEPEASR